MGKYWQFNLFLGNKKNMLSISETEQARRKFFSSCEFIVRVPATYYLKGTPFSSEATIFLLNSYIDVGISKGKNKKILDANYASPRLNFFEPRSKGTLETSFVDAYLRLDDIAERRINISSASRALLKNSTFRLWCPFAIDHPLLNLQEDISTAFGLLAYCVENNIRSQEGIKSKDWEWQEALCIDDGNAVDISRIYRRKSLPSLRRITEALRFCWLLQDINNGSTCFASMIGVSGLSDFINFKVSSPDDHIESLLKERHPVKFFDFIDKSLAHGSIYLGMERNEGACSMLLGYTQDKKEKFWGSMLTPYFFDDLKKVTLNIIPKSTALGTERWPWRFEYNSGYFAIFAPRNLMKNIKEEIKFMQHTWIHYDIDVFESWPHIGARIEQIDKTDG